MELLKSKKGNLNYLWVLWRLLHRVQINAFKILHRVLILSGSHGDRESGRSGLTDIERLRDSADKNAGDITIRFYEGDCMRAGLKPVKPRVKIEKLPIAADEIPDITQAASLITCTNMKVNLIFFLIWSYPRTGLYINDSEHLCNLNMILVSYRSKRWTPPSSKTLSSVTVRFAT